MVIVIRSNSDSNISNSNSINSNSNGGFPRHGGKAGCIRAYSAAVSDEAHRAHLAIELKTCPTTGLKARSKEYSSLFEPL